MATLGRTTDLEALALLNVFQLESNDFERSMDPLHRKQTGSYYTSLELTNIMMSDLVYSLDKAARKRLYAKRFFEPCVGTGNFVFAYLNVCRTLSFTQAQYRQLLNNIYACDINASAIELYKKNLSRLAKQWFGIELGKDYFDTHIGGGLIFNVDDPSPTYIPVTSIFPESVICQGFDIIATNPPYKNLKVERGHYESDAEYSSDKGKYDIITRLAAKCYQFSASGIINLYKLFTEEILTQYLASDGICSLLIPASILTDKTCGKLRTYILTKCGLRSIRLIAENNAYIDASQALCALLIHMGKATSDIYVDGMLNGRKIKGATIDVNNIIDPDTDNSVLVLTENEYAIRNRMRTFPKIKDIPYIKNLRGELDLTLNGDKISTSPTPFQLVRGRNIGYYKLVDISPKEYALGSFVSSTAKRKYIQHSRLVCQQIANMAKKRRVSFALAPANVVLGNSCNFIYIEDNADGVDEYFLLGVLNSSLIDWFFKLTSSNNHINNYEIDNFPIPIHSPYKEQIASLVQSYLKEADSSLLQKIEQLVYKSYHLEENRSISPDRMEASYSVPYSVSLWADLKNLINNISLSECEAILDDRASIKDICFQKKLLLSPFEMKVLGEIEKKYRKLKQGQILNHTTFKLSALDLEMIAPIPQGGNWEDIPLATREKSRRLVRITETGGRTTLYGRIDYTKPAYTITTYFNRPGNGTYVHPIHDRVISVREAARFQTFPDSYFFCGNKADMLNQIGNAVPVLLAYNIARSIKEKIGCTTSVDLFSGAGGMTYGFKLAGIHAAIATDISESACLTLKVNSPEIPVLCGDITKEEIKNSIITRGISCGADIICGGPPCQGFSLAGFRDKNDPRNQLFRHFVDVVSKVKPKVIVFENVEGILSYENGATYREIIELFSELGYDTEGRKLSAHEYGVPQKRKRVIILCTRKDLGIKPDTLYPQPTTLSDESQISAYDAIFDLESIPCGEAALYREGYSSALIKYLRGEIDAEQYETLVKK